eukprot:gene8560-biopygen8549
MDLTSLLCMYPVSAVFTAVSTRPSLPPIVWNQNSWGWSPVKNEFATKPRSFGSRENRRKCGKARWMNPSPIRFPVTVCWPRTAAICPMLSGDPLDPHMLMMNGAFAQCKIFMHCPPQSARTCERIPLSLLSTVISSVHPGSASRVPSLKLLMSTAQSSYPFWMYSFVTALSSFPGVTSSMPMLNPRFISHVHVSRDNRHMHFAAYAWPADKNSW